MAKTDMVKNLLLTWDDFKKELSAFLPIAGMFGDFVARQGNGALEEPKKPKETSQTQTAEETRRTRKINHSRKNAWVYWRIGF